MDSERLVSALLDSDRATAGRILDEHLDPSQQGQLAEVLDGLVAPALVAIGEAWEAGTIALSQVYASGLLCQTLVADRVPAGVTERAAQPRIAVGVLDDAHVLGKVIVVQMLRSAGYRVADWGARLEVADIVDRAVEEDVEVLMLSVLMLRSALKVAEVRAGLMAAGLDVTIVVGGAPFRLDSGLAAEVGADHVGASAADVLPIMSRIEAARRLDRPPRLHLTGRRSG